MSEAVKITKAQRRRIEEELDNPYHGWMYDGPGGRQRLGRYVRYRIEDVEAILRSALSKDDTNG